MLHTVKSLLYPHISFRRFHIQKYIICFTFTSYSFFIFIIYKCSFRFRPWLHTQLFCCRSKPFQSLMYTKLFSLPYVSLPFRLILGIKIAPYRIIRCLFYLHFSIKIYIIKLGHTEMRYDEQ